MTFLREVFLSAVLLTPAPAQTGLALLGDVHVIFSNSAARAIAMQLSYPVEIIRRDDIRNIHVLCPSDRQDILLPLMKNALRSLSRHIVAAARAYEPAKTMLIIGIRG